MHRSHLFSADILGVLEGESENSLRCHSGDKLNALDDSFNDNVLNSGVFSFGILPDQDSVDVVIWSLKSCYGFARPYIGEKVEGPSERKIE